MKTARVTLWRNSRPTSENSPNLSGAVELPCELIAELYQMMQAGQYEAIGYEPQVAGFSLRTAAWISPSNDPNSKRPEVSGYIDSKSEMNAYAAQRAQAPVAPAPAPAPQQWQQPVQPQPAAPAQPAWQAPPAQQAPAAPGGPAYQPPVQAPPYAPQPQQPAPAANPPAWNGWG